MIYGPSYESSVSELQQNYGSEYTSDPKRSMGNFKASAPAGLPPWAEEDEEYLKQLENHRTLQDRREKTFWNYLVGRQTTYDTYSMQHDRDPTAIRTAPLLRKMRPDLHATRTKSGKLLGDSITNQLNQADRVCTVFTSTARSPSLLRFMMMNSSHRLQNTSFTVQAKARGCRHHRLQSTSPHPND